jgi:microcystin-dependent protein
MAVFCPLSTQPVFWQQQLQVAAQVTFYNAGTLTPRSAYGDGLLTVPLAQPVLTDGNGCIPEIWIQGTNPYKLRILASTGVLIREVDNLPGDVAGASPPPPPPPGTVTLQTGDMVWAYTTTIIPGRVRANGKTIGNPISGGSEFADDTAQPLFEFLWNADPTLVVVGGRGLSASADWTANKAITLPDVNGRVVVGIDGMGSSPTNRLAGITFGKGDAHTLGSTAGTAQVTQTLAQLAAHTHTATTQSAGSHQHTGTTDANAVSSANAVTDVQGSHAHGGATAGSGNIGAAGATDAQGNHSHGGVTGTENQSHTHVGAAQPASIATGAGPGAASQYWWGGGVGNTSGESTSHNHNIADSGNHTHNVTVTVPNHTHGIPADGAHAHNVTVTLVAHQHTFTSNPAGIHVHTLTTDDVLPAAQPMDNTQPFILMTAYLVL